MADQADERSFKTSVSGNPGFRPTSGDSWYTYGQSRENQGKYIKVSIEVDGEQVAMRLSWDIIKS